MYKRQNNHNIQIVFIYFTLFYILYITIYFLFYEYKKYIINVFIYEGERRNGATRILKSEKQAGACYLYQQTYRRGGAFQTLIVRHKVLTSNTL